MNRFAVMLLALVIWREARGEGEDGMRAVAHVIRNRVEKWGKSWNKIITGNAQFSSMTIRGDTQTVKWPADGDPQFESASKIASAVYSGQDDDLTHGALYYANLETETSEWFKDEIVDKSEVHQKLAVIGRQTFFA